MQRTFTDVLFAILETINYVGDKQTFIEKFEKLNREEAMMNILEQLPQEIQKKIKEHPDKKEAILAYVSQRVYQQEVIRVSQKALRELLTAIEKHVTTKQKESILKLVR